MKGVVLSCSNWSEQDVTAEKEYPVFVSGQRVYRLHREYLANRVIIGLEVANSSRMVAPGKARTSESKLGTAPVTTLSVIPDGVVSPHPDPVRDGPVLPHLLRQFLLDHEGLM
ncbi:unnamed protein product [Vicia faba]|uniref:Uncharacterized protein n=1 Tax=Vicia faba TaxID=3906 RepID=A0AAV0ZUC9_VICFA|nr:unnamed protein product [Vicia faba]